MDERSDVHIFNTISPNDSLKSLNISIAVLCGVPSADQRLLHKGKALADDLTLTDHAVERGDTIHVLKEPEDFPTLPETFPALSTARMCGRSVRDDFGSALLPIQQHGNDRLGREVGVFVVRNTHSRQLSGTWSQIWTMATTVGPRPRSGSTPIS